MEMIKNLMVVFEEKDRDIFEQIKMLVETDDDTEDFVIGTKDGMVNVVECDDAKWQTGSQAEFASDINNKILFIGDIKGVALDNVTPLQYGVSYALNENRLQILVDEKHKWTREEYDEFLVSLRRNVDNITTQSDAFAKSENKEQKKVKMGLAIGGALLFAPLAIAVAAKSISESNEDKKLLRKQMLLYGVTQLYYRVLPDFIEN